MRKYYEFDLNRKLLYLQKYRKAQPAYLRKDRIGVGFMVLAVVLAVGLTCGFTFGAGEGASGPAPIPVIAAMTGLVVGCIPFIIGTGIRNGAKHKYGAPYGDMSKEFLCVDEDGMEFGYYPANCRYTTGMDVYHISFSELNRIRFDAELGILTVVGKGRLTAYDDYAAGAVNEEKSGRQFHSYSEFSFMLPLKEQEGFLKLLEAKQRWEE